MRNEKACGVPGYLCDGKHLRLTYQDLLEEVLAVAQAVEIGQFPSLGGVGIGEQG